MRQNIPSVISLIGAVFFLATLPAQLHALTPDQVFDKVKDSIVVVKTLDAQGKVKGQGSGVLLPSGKIATNCHVVEGGASYQVGRGKQIVSATLYAEDGDKDICILDANGLTGKPVQLGKAAGLKVGVPVYAVGAPKGLELSLSDGIVAQLRGGPPPLIQTTAAISPGSSGGGLFDGEGRLVGLTTLYIEGGQSLNFAMPVEWIGDVKPGRKMIAGGHGKIEWKKRASALSLKDWDALLDWCQKWTKSEPKEVEAWYYLGNAFTWLSRYNEAIEAFREALRLNPEYATAWSSLGDVYNNLKRYDEAIEAYNQVLRLNPKNADGWSGRGRVYNKLKRYNEAIEAFREALRLNPKNEYYWYLLGLVYYNLDRYDQAIEAYRQALRISPEAHYWYVLGYAYENHKRYNEAIEAFREALRLNPELGDAWYGLAISYVGSGNRKAAEDAARELRRFDPVKADKLFNLIGPR